MKSIEPNGESSRREMLVGSAAILTALAASEAAGNSAEKAKARPMALAANKLLGILRERISNAYVTTLGTEGETILFWGNVQLAPGVQTFAFDYDDGSTLEGIPTVNIQAYPQKGAANTGLSPIWVTSNLSTTKGEKEGKNRIGLEVTLDLAAGYNGHIFAREKDAWDQVTRELVKKSILTIHVIGLGRVKLS